MADQIILGYWGIRGLGQPVRYFLEYLGLPYQDKRYVKPEDWFGEIAQPPLNNLVLANLPYIKDGDKWVFESQALYVYLAHRANRADLLGSTPEEQVLVAQARGVLQDVIKALYGLFVFPEEQYQAQKVEYFKTEVVWLLEKLNKFLDGRKWVVGDNITYVDFVIFEFEETLQAYDANAFEQLNALKKHHQNVAELPKIKEYIHSDKFLARPFLPPGRSRWY